MNLELRIALSVKKCKAESLKMEQGGFFESITDTLNEIFQKFNELCQVTAYEYSLDTINYNRFKKLLIFFFF